MGLYAGTRQNFVRLLTKDGDATAGKIFRSIMSALLYLQNSEQESMKKCGATIR